MNFKLQLSALAPRWTVVQSLEDFAALCRYWKRVFALPPLAPLLTHERVSSQTGCLLHTGRRAGREGGKWKEGWEQEGDRRRYGVKPVDLRRIKLRFIGVDAYSPHVHLDVETDLICDTQEREVATCVVMW